MWGSSSKKTLTKRGIKKIDTLVTGMILGGIIASIYGIKRNEASQENLKERILKEGDRHTLGSILRMLVFGAPVENQQNPATIWQKIANFFRWKN